MIKIREYAKALTAGAVVAVTGTIANVVDAIDANIEPVWVAVGALVSAVMVAVVPNKPPAA